MYIAIKLWVANHSCHIENENVLESYCAYKTQKSNPNVCLC